MDLISRRAENSNFSRDLISRIKDFQILRANLISRINDSQIFRADLISRNFPLREIKSARNLIRAKFNLREI